MNAFYSVPIKDCTCSQMGLYILHMTGQGSSKAQKGTDAVIPQDGLIKFLQTRVGMTREIALKTIPGLAKLLSKGVEAFQAMHKDATDSNSNSQEKYMDHEAFLARVCEEQLRLESLSQEERLAIIDNMQDGAIRLYEKDSENKVFTQKLFKLAAKGVVTALALVVVILSWKSINDNGTN
jgi:hypothetical protein